MPAPELPWSWTQFRVYLGPVESTHLLPGTYWVFSWPVIGALPSSPCLHSVESEPFPLSLSVCLSVPQRDLCGPWLWDSWLVGESLPSPSENTEIETLATESRKTRDGLDLKTLMCKKLPSWAGDLELHVETSVCLDLPARGLLGQIKDILFLFRIMYMSHT